MCSSSQAVFQELLGRCQARAQGRKKFRFKNKLVSLDSTVIDLCATLFDWAKFRHTKGAVKLHGLLDHDGDLPSVVVLTEGKRHDVRVARPLRFDAGTVVVMDRGYVDYAWFGQLTAQAVFFVTRLKAHAVYTVVERRRGAGAQRRPAGRDHPVDGRRRRDEMPAAAAPGRGGRPRQARHPGLPDESPRLRSHDDRRHLQGSLVDRVVFQGPETGARGAAHDDFQEILGRGCG